MHCTPPDPIDPAMNTRHLMNFDVIVHPTTRTHLNFETELRYRAPLPEHAVWWLTFAEWFVAVPMDYDIYASPIPTLDVYRSTDRIPRLDVAIAPIEVFIETCAAKTRMAALFLLPTDPRGSWEYEHARALSAGPTTGNPWQVWCAGRPLEIQWTQKIKRL